MTKRQMAEGKKKDTKKCGVCGDSALGSNFNAITCESCKAFFRRNALKKKEFKCPFEGSCKVDIVTRRFCQKCRLKKCFDIGMKKEWIMTDEEKQAKREKIEKNRQKRSNQQQQSETSNFDSFQVKMENPDPVPVIKEVSSPISNMSPLTPQTPGSVTVVESCPSNVKLFSQPLTPSDCEYSPPSKVIVIDSSLPSTELEELVHDSQDNNSNLPSPQQEVEISSDGEGIFLAKEENNSNATSTFSTDENNENAISVPEDALPESVYTKALAIEYMFLPIRETYSSLQELSTIEKNKLDELVTANEVMKMPLSCDLPDPSLLDVLNLTDHAIRRLIKMSKKIHSFKTLCPEDQIALLKGSCTELMILRSVMAYDPGKDCWRHSLKGGSERMSIKVDILKEAKGNVYQEHKRFIDSFRPKWRADENIMLLLSAIALFTPDRLNVIHKDTIRLEQYSYYYLLRRYLDTICDNNCNASDDFLKLVRRMEQLHILNEKHVRVYLDLNPKDVEPLLIEIFDLKH